MIYWPHQLTETTMDVIINQEDRDTIAAALRMAETALSEYYHDNAPVMTMLQIALAKVTAK